MQEPILPSFNPVVGNWEVSIDLRSHYCLLVPMLMGLYKVCVPVSTRFGRSFGIGLCAPTCMWPLI